MNVRVAFDTHAFVKRLEAAGMSVTHAEALADAMGDIVLQSVATKADLKEVELSLRSELNELRKELKELELRLTLRMGAMITAAIAILAALKILT
jgi:hypothetical protein